MTPIIGFVLIAISTWFVLMIIAKFLTRSFKDEEGPDDDSES